MLSMQPQHVLILDSVMADPLSMRRVERMLPHVPAAQVHVLSEAELDAWVARQGYGYTRWGQRSAPRDPDLCFVRARWDTDEVRAERARRYPHLGYRHLLGYGSLLWREDGTDDWRSRQGTICQPAWELHSAFGCPFRCAYCGLGDAIGLYTNIEEQIEHLPEAFAGAPRQAIWKWDNQTDVNCFEPQWDATAPLIERFAQERGRWLLLYTGKSDNVDFMLDLDHGGQTVICWSLSPQTQATALEPRTAGARERVEAAAKCQQAGYTARYRFSPIIPVNGWREEYTALIAHLFEVSRPDVISLCPFGWMDAAAAESCLGPDILDPEALAAMRAAGRDEDWPGSHGSPLPFDYRREMLAFLIEEIQRHGTATRISICLDTPRMWKALGQRVGQGPDRYFCNCGGHCAPRRRDSEAVSATA
jgi:hypothetical protein